jgi:hypothetical protein
LRITHVRSTRGDPASLTTLASVFATALRLDPGPIERAFAPADAAQESASCAADQPWRLVFEDDFRMPQLAKEWVRKEGKFTVAQGCLAGRGEIYLDRPLPGDQRIEYEAWVNRDQSPSDLSAFLASKGGSSSDSYFFGFGSNANGLNKLMKEQTAVFSVAQPLIEPGKRHKIACQKSGRRLTWWVDGTQIMDFLDIHPLAGPYAGFYIDSIGQIGHVRVYARGRLPSGAARP